VLWWCYFHRAERTGVEVAERVEDADAVGWWGTWTPVTIRATRVVVLLSLGDVRWRDDCARSAS
jgi:hypothetical protein